MNKKLRIERLTELEYMLLNHKKVFKAQGIIFDLGNWAEKVCDYTAAKIFSKKKGVADKKELCGSAACALGSAAIHDPFVKQGLCLKNDGVSSESETDEDGLEIIKYEADFIPFYKGAEGVNAGAKFFGIDDYEADHLFMPGAYDNDNPSAKEVAVRVRKLINDYQEAA